MEGNTINLFPSSECVKQENRFQSPISPLHIDPQIVYFDTGDDDWSGLSSQAERRKRQNRIHQRAWRKRRIVQERTDHGLKSIAEKSAKTTELVWISENFEGAKPRTKGCIAAYNDKLWNSLGAVAGSSKLDVSKLPQLAALCTAEANETLLRFEEWANSKRSAASPTADNVLVLAKLNVFRALVMNSMIIGLRTEDLMKDETVSPFCAPSDLKINALALPPSLQPTLLQTQISHHPWIDLLPIPGMRDNILRAYNDFDDMALCGDLVGFFSASNCGLGMIVWNQPWDTREWEVTDAFLKHWGWTVKGCYQLFESTNRWRAMRGERLLQLRSLSALPSQL